MINKLITSRHAKRRIKLYGINKENTINVIKDVSNKSNGQYEIIDSKFKSKYRLPLKVVYIIEKNVTTIITSYPLKKDIKDENSI